MFAANLWPERWGAFATFSFVANDDEGHDYDKKDGEDHDRGDGTGAGVGCLGLGNIIRLFCRLCIIVGLESKVGLASPDISDRVQQSWETYCCRLSQFANVSIVSGHVTFQRLFYWNRLDEEI